MRIASRVVAAALICGLAGCAGGDFGRTRSSALNDDMHRWVGQEPVASLGDKPSAYQLTDTERSLRDFAYFFIEPPHSRPAWKTVFGDYDPLPSPWRRAPRFDRTAYGRLLIDEPHRSHASRYAVLIDDIRNDVTRLDPFFSVVARVNDMDKRRTAALGLLGDVSLREREDATTRMRENALILAWVEQCLDQRISSYKWALERLVLQAPDPQAAEADRMISLLAQRASGVPWRAGPLAGAAVVSKG
jgi:hypothetical protein